MTNIVVLCHERYRLTMQCINSIRNNTKEGTYTLTLVDDDSQDFRVQNFLRDQALYHPKDTTLLDVIGSNHCLGALKNLGIWHTGLRFGQGQWLCVLDNDVCITDPQWLEQMQTRGNPALVNHKSLVGGCRHPFHGVNRKDDKFDHTDAVAGYCHFMSWEAWGLLGPYDSNAPGIGQSEDFALSRKFADIGFPVGYMNPPVMTHCGITNSKGEPIAGADQIERVPGVLYL